MELSAPVPYVLLGLPDGPEGVRVTLSAMRKLARTARLDSRIQQLAAQITQGIPRSRYREHATAIHNWIFKNIRYLASPTDIESVADPIYTLQIESGKCADMVTLEAALLDSIGHESRFVAAAFEPDLFSHVYLQTLIGEDWISSDPTEPNGFGWEPPGVISRLIRNV